MKKFLAALLAVAMVFSMTACGDGKSADGKVKLSMWCIATEADSNRASYENAIKDMQAKYPDIEFTWEAFENQSYKTKIKAAISADDMPDIFFTWSCAFLGDFVNADKVYCLDDAFKGYESAIDEKMLINTTYNGKHYGVPLTMNIVTMFANMDLLKQVGYNEVPGTYEDFIACCDALKAAGITPFGCAGGETWCVTEYLEPIIEKTIGATALSDVFSGNASWNNAEIAAAVDTFQGLVNKGYFNEDAMSLSNDEVKANFMAGKYAFYQNGSWNCADFAKNAEFFPKVKASEFPVINADKATLGMLIGGPSDTLAVAKCSKNAEAAAKYCVELGQLICKYGYLDGCGLPAWKVDYATDNVNDLTKTVADIVANSKQMVLFGDTAQEANDADIYLKAVEKVYGCLTDGKGFTSSLAADIR